MPPPTQLPAVPPFTVDVRANPPTLTPIFKAEAKPDGTDLLKDGSRAVIITDGTGATKVCLLFIPSANDPGSNKIHVCWGPGSPGSEALTCALRVALNAVGWLLLVIPGADPGFVTISAEEIVEILRKVGRPPRIDALRLSAHSRGFRGLAATLNKDLLVQRNGTAVAPKVGPGLVERLINFDAYYFDFAKAINASNIPASKVFGYRVTVPSVGTPTPGNWSASASQTIDFSPVLTGVRAVIYSRLIQDSIAIGKHTQNPPAGRTLADITGRLLTNLPPLGDFSSRSSPTDFRKYCKDNAAAIRNCMRDEQNTDLDHAAKGPLIEFVNGNNLADIGAFTAAIWPHQLFVAEFAHEVTDGLDPKP